MEPERNHLNPHNIDPSRIDPAHHLPDVGKMDRVDRAPGFDSVREGKPREMAYDQAVRVIKAMGKYIVERREGGTGMTNDEAAKVLTEIAQGMVDQIKEFKGDGFSEDDLPGIIEGALISLTAIETAIEALQPWVRTADRAPTEEDADKEGKVLAWSALECEDNIRVEWWVSVGVHAEDWTWWMPIPPLPEVTE